MKVHAIETDHRGKDTLRFFSSESVLIKTVRPLRMNVSHNSCLCDRVSSSYLS